MILCLGDSNTKGLDPRSYIADEYDYPWPAILSNLLNEEVVNAGENGIEIYHTKEDFIYLNSTIKDPDYIICMIGTNDILNQVSLSMIEERLNCFVQYLIKWNLILICPKDIIGFPSLKSIYQKISDLYTVPLLDCNEWNIEMAYDDIHFSELGHEQFANALYKQLKCL